MDQFAFPHQNQSRRASIVGFGVDVAPYPPSKTMKADRGSSS
jgi:hypothetical protein